MTSFGRLVVPSLFIVAIAEGCSSSALDPGSGHGGSAGTGVSTGGQIGSDGGARGPACSSADAPTRVTVGLVHSSGSAPSGATIDAGATGANGVDVTGNVTTVERAPSSGDVVVTIADGPSASWTFRISPASAGDSWEATARELIGHQVSLKYRYRMRFQAPWSVGFVLTDAQGLVMAAETGPWVSTLDAEVPLSVRRGAAICRMPTCSSTPGPLEPNDPGTPFYELVFVGDTEVAVGMTMDRELTIGGRAYLAHNSGAPFPDPFMGCSDAEYVDKWAVWRRAPHPTTE